MTVSEFDAPPQDPVGLAMAWWHRAVTAGVRDPGLAALATADAQGRVSNRIVQTIAFTDSGWVFTSHADSRKGRDIAATGQGSAVFYWNESGEQLILTGAVGPVPDAESDRLWAVRPPSTHPMSVAAHQSDLLDSEVQLRARAQRLADSGQPLPRPAAWLGYALTPSTVEFWRFSADRLHRRLRYDRTDAGWSSCRLQP